MEVLLIEDSLGDVALVKEAAKEVNENIHLSVVTDGAQAMDYLLRKTPFNDAPTPDLILLDLNIPKKNGKEILHDIKSHSDLKHIPVVILTISQDERDV